MKLIPIFLYLLVAGALAVCPVAVAGTETISELAAEHKLGGGLAVIGGDHAATDAIALAESGRWLVRVISADPIAAEQAVAGLYPLITVAASSASLGDQTVNLVVVGGAVAAEDAKRLIAPGGLLIEAGVASKAAMNQEQAGWTHWLGDEYGRGISQDMTVAPSNSLRWWDQSMLGMQLRAADGAVVVYEKMANEVPGNRSSRRISDLMGLDVYSGVPLWREAKPMYPNDTMNRHGFTAGATQFVHVPNNKEGAYAVVRDVRTGALIHTLEEGLKVPVKKWDKKYSTQEENDYNDAVLGSRAEAEPIMQRKTGTSSHFVIHLIHGDVLIQGYGKQLVALDLQTGKRLWFQALAYPVARIILADDGKRLFIQEALTTRLDRVRWGNTPAAALSCRSISDGGELWRNDEIKEHSISELIQLDGDIFAFDVIANIRSKFLGDYDGDLYRFDHRTGALKWRYPNINEYKTSAKKHGPMINNPVAWNGAIYAGSGGTPRRFHADAPGQTKITVALNGNGRCVRMTGTPKYLLTGFGAMMDTDGNWFQTHLNRGNCAMPNFVGYGAVLGVSDSTCSCYNGLRGQVALVPPRSLDVVEDRLLQLTAALPQPKGDLPEGPITDAWTIEPALRLHFAQETLTGDIGAGWQATLNIQRHQLTMQRDGEMQWQYRAGARVQTLPVLHNELVYVACFDGTITALNVADGSVAWQFLAAPNHDEVVVNGQLESRWPVHNLVINNELIYAVAGRHSELDGGLWCWAIDPATGAVKQQARLFSDISRLESGGNVKQFEWRRRRNQANNQILNGGVFVDEQGQVCIANRKWSKKGSSASYNGYWKPFNATDKSFHQYDYAGRQPNPDNPSQTLFALDLEAWNQQTINPVLVFVERNPGVR